MKKKLYLVRHGQTLFNEKGRIQGWCDSPITELGKKQAEATRKYLDEHNVHPDHFYCSTLGRTEQTMKAMYPEADYERKEGLKEFGYGTLEGDDIESAKPKGSLETAYVPYGGESKSQVEERMYKTLKDIMDNPEAKNVLAISHGSSSFRFASKVDPDKAKKLRKFANCLIYEFDYEDGKFHLVSIKDGHIKDLEKQLEAEKEKETGK